MPITRTAMIDDDGSGTTGTILNNAWKVELYNQIDAFVNPVYAAWTAYTPAWKTSGTPQPAIGNGQIGGRYIQTGKTVHVVLGMLCGSTSTYGGAGIYSWTLPAGLIPVNAGGTSTYTFLITLLNSGGGGQPPCATYAIASGEIYGITASGGAVGPTIPFTWAANCAVAIRGTYDVA